MKWSDVGTPAQVLEKKLRKYRAKMNSPELTPSKRKEYLGKIKHYSAKAAELEVQEESSLGAVHVRGDDGFGEDEEATEESAARSHIGSRKLGVDVGVVPGRGDGRGHVRGQSKAASPATVDAAGTQQGGIGWRVGDRCHAGAALGAGTVRFVGQCLELAKGSGAAGAQSLWAGVELDHPRGKHDGYVTCPLLCLPACLPACAARGHSWMVGCGAEWLSVSVYRAGRCKGSAISSAHRSAACS